MIYKKTIEYLDRCIEKDMLSHAYIFYGPDDQSKKNTALEFAYRVINADDSSNGFHPDIMIISTDNDEGRSINTVRQLRKFVSLSPYSGKYKIAIIEGAEKLNIYAQDALLKVFEEAPVRSIIIICTRTIESISATIASRGIKLPFWRQFIELPIDEKILKIFNHILNTGAKDQYNSLEKLNGLKAAELFKMWLVFLRNEFFINPSEKLAKILKVSQNIFFKLNETNINPKLAYDELILSLSNNY